MGSRRVEAEPLPRGFRAPAERRRADSRFGRRVQRRTEAGLSSHKALLGLRHLLPERTRPDPRCAGKQHVGDLSSSWSSASCARESTTVREPGESAHSPGEEALGWASPLRRPAPSPHLRLRLRRRVRHGPPARRVIDEPRNNAAGLVNLVAVVGPPPPGRSRWQAAHHDSTRPASAGSGGTRTASSPSRISGRSSLFPPLNPPDD